MSPTLPLQQEATDSIFNWNNMLFETASTESTNGWGMMGDIPTKPLIHTDAVISTLIFCLLIFMVFWRMTYSQWNDYISDFLFSTSRQKSKTPDTHHKHVIIITALLFCFDGAVLAYILGRHLTTITNNISLWVILATYTIVFIGYLILKHCLYNIVHKIFFLNSQIEIWNKNHNFLFIIETVSMFPLTLFLIFLNVNIQISTFLFLLLFLFVKIFLIFKCYTSFFAKSHGALHLFMYFCSLEVAPFIILCASLIEITRSLTLL